MVPAVVRALAVLDLLARQRAPMSMAGLATTLGLPKSSVHGLCSTLLSCGYLRRVDNGTLHIGPRVMGLAEAFVASTTVGGEFAAMWRELPTPPEETLILSVLNGTDVVYIGVLNSARPLGLAFTIGMHLPAHLAATGKAMLAFRDPAAVRALYAAGPLPRLTERGVRTLDELMVELAASRKRGYSVDDEAVREGVFSIAAPVFDISGAPVAGIAVCLNKAGLTAAAIKRQREVVLRAARALSQRLGAARAS